MTKAVRDLSLIEQDLVDLNNGVLTVTGRLVDASNATLYAMCSVKMKEVIANSLASINLLQVNDLCGIFQMAH